MMLVGLAMFLAGLVLGKFPDQEGYNISRTEMRRFEQAALLIPAEELPPEVSPELRQALLDDLTALSKNRDPHDKQRKRVADALVVRMKDLMQQYCEIARADPGRYGKAYTDEFGARLASAEAGPGRAIQENGKAGPLALFGMLLYMCGALMRMRYD